MRTNEKWTKAYWEWQEAGNAPATRELAMKGIKKCLADMGIPLEGADLKRRLAASFTSEDGTETEINSSLSYIYWDLTANSGRALDYSKDFNYLTGLIEQAQRQLTSVRHAIATVNGTVYIPQSVVVAGSGTGRRRLVTLSKAQIVQLVEAQTNETIIKLSRWQEFGADSATIIAAMKKIERAILGPLKATPAERAKTRIVSASRRKLVKVIKPVRRKIAA